MLVESNYQMSYDFNHKIKHKVQNFKCHNARGQGRRMGHTDFWCAHYAYFCLPVNIP